MSKHLYIAHGYNANSHKNWFDWLKNQFPEVDGHLIDFPNSTEPKLEEWSQTLKENIDLSSGENIIVAHSLGVITVLDMISNVTSDINIKGLVLVAGFDEKIIKFPELDGFIESTNVDYEKIKDVVPYRVVIGATKDPTVSYPLSKSLAERLDAKVFKKHHDGHFCEEDGYDSFPEVKYYVEEILNKE
ncbi:RBBP9/YdeN family alpha/beta hydrolase [Mammaliicoccus lentus]|uniref:RBBP9/YdeN family alpha/beta hydrolase n=1 Tax=Mammaliicoccus lentus TaxID=42858 RepID=UPI0007D90419|nr:alpha/beta hydrolase [Mammaliicoccus lentus]OAO18412.1 hypothetical protein AXY34_12700 [Mammaliicoccus lentus]